MSFFVRQFAEDDLPDALALWNSIVESGNAFPQTEPLTTETAQQFFGTQTYVGIAECDGAVAGLYILHPNNVGRCAHIANASYAVEETFRSQGIGRALVEDSLATAKAKGFKIMQFNAVVASNTNAIKLYKSLGFQQLGTIPQGFKLNNGTYQDILPFYKIL